MHWKYASEIKQHGNDSSVHALYAFPVFEVVNLSYLSPILSGKRGQRRKKKLFPSSGTYTYVRWAHKTDGNPEWEAERNKMGEAILSPQMLVSEVN